MKKKKIWILFSRCEDGDRVHRVFDDKREADYFWDVLLKHSKWYYLKTYDVTQSIK